MPIGALPVKAMMLEGGDAAKRRIDAILQENLPPLLTEPVFYAIGGGWRALARVHIATATPRSAWFTATMFRPTGVRALAKKIARMSPEEVAALPDAAEPADRHPARRVAGDVAGAEDR